MAPQAAPNAANLDSRSGPDLRIHRFAPSGTIGQTTCSARVGEDDVAPRPLDRAERARDELPTIVGEVERITDAGLGRTGDQLGADSRSFDGPGQLSTDGQVPFEPDVAVAIADRDAQVVTQMVLGVLGDEHAMRTSIRSGVGRAGSRVHVATIPGPGSAGKVSFPASIRFG